MPSIPWDIPGAVKAAADLGKELLRVAAPSADEQGKTLEVKQANRLDQARQAFREFAAKIRANSQARRLAAERDLLELEEAKRKGGKDGGSGAS